MISHTPITIPGFTHIVRCFLWPSQATSSHFSCAPDAADQAEEQKEGPANIGKSMAMTQEPIDWRYLPYISPTVCKAYVREYPNKIWPYMVQYLHFRILEFPLSLKTGFSEKGTISIRKLINHQHVGIFIYFQTVGELHPKVWYRRYSFWRIWGLLTRWKMGMNIPANPSYGAHEVPGVWAIAISIYKKTDSWSRKKWDTLW